MEKEKGLTNTQIKTVALFFMLIDHIGVSVVSEFIKVDGSAEGLIAYYICRLFGRVAFPLFCFLITEGIVHTHSLGKYAMRMWLFAIISEVPFDLMGEGVLFFLQAQNVFWTFALFLTALAAAQKWNRSIWPYALAAAIAAWILKTDYGWAGILLLYLMMCAKPVIQQAGGVILITDASVKLFQDPMIGVVMAIIPCVCLVSILRQYNGKRGRNVNKYLFYGFYPVHMLALWMCALWIKSGM